MDCEKLDEMAIDLVYDELEPSAAAEAEQHLVDCLRCSALVERLRAGQRGAAALQLESPPLLLEARILEAAGKARRPIPWPRRLSRAISTAGAYAMRPQVAMAAVLVMMVGMSALLLHGRNGEGVRRTRVTDEGTPVATMQQEAQGAPAVIGGSGGESAFRPPAERSAAHAEKAKEAKGDEGGAADGELADKPGGLAQGLAGDDLDETASPSASAATGKKLGAPGGPADDIALKDKSAENLPKSAATAEGAAMAKGAPPAPAAMPTGTASPTTATATGGASAPSFDDAMKAYGEGRFAAAAKGFDASFAAGARASSSLLYAARSYRAQGSSAPAMSRFARVLSDYPSSADAPYAAVEGGEYSRDLGDVATARTLLEKARGYAVTKSRAEADLAALDAPSFKASAKPPAATKAADSKPAP